jgi:hypothetical protein
MSHFLAHFFQHMLKESFPKFAYWLYYSEMVIVLILALIYIWMPPIGTMVGAGLLVYAGFNWVGACNYGRKRAVEHGVAWSPSRFDRGVAIYLNVGMGVLGGGLVYLGYDEWIGIGLGLAILLIGVFNLVTLLKGGWVEFP